jgi:hypothetical protein
MDRTSHQQKLAVDGFFNLKKGQQRLGDIVIEM